MVEIGVRARSGMGGGAGEAVAPQGDSHPSSGCPRSRDQHVLEQSSLCPSPAALSHPQSLSRCHAASRERQTIIPRGVPYMTKLLRYFMSEDSIFLHLEHVQGEGPPWALGMLFSSMAFTRQTQGQGALHLCSTENLALLEAEWQRWAAVGLCVGPRGQGVSWGGCAQAGWTDGHVCSCPFCHHFSSHDFSFVLSVPVLWSGT